MILDSYAMMQEPCLVTCMDIIQYLIHFVVFQDSRKEIIESDQSSPLNTKLKVCLFYLVFKIEFAFH